MAYSANGKNEIIAEVEIDGAGSRQLSSELLTTFAAHRYVIDKDHAAMSELARISIERVLSSIDLNSILTAWQASPAIFIIRNAAVIDRLPPTPVSGFADDTAVANLDAVLLGFLSVLGVAPTAYAFENNGRMARNVVPNPEFADADSSWGFGTTLAWHQDNNFQPFEFDRNENADIPPMPRYLAFLGLRNHEKIPTQLLTLSAALRGLPGDVILRLQERSYKIAPPQSVGADERDDQAAQILTYRDGVAFSRFDASDGIQGLGEDASAALDALRQTVANGSPEAVSALLNPGDILIIDNYRVMHRREGFRPHSVEEGRWLRRVYGLTAIQQTTAA